MNGYESYIIDSGTTFSLMESLRLMFENTLMTGIITGLIANGITGIVGYVIGYIIGKKSKKKSQSKLGEEVNKLKGENDQLKETLSRYEKVERPPYVNYIRFPAINPRTAFCPICWDDKDKRQQVQMSVKDEESGIRFNLRCPQCGHTAKQKLHD